METLRNSLVPALGRVLLSVLFIWGGFGKLMAMQGTIGYFQADHVPLPELAYYVAVVVELVGGLALLLGLATRWTALVLGIWCLATAAVGHGFGDMDNSIHTLKNVAMAGGFLYVFAYGAGAWSIDAVTSGRRSGAALKAA